MNQTEVYSIIRKQVLYKLHFPPKSAQLWQYGDMTSEEIIQEVAIDVFKHWEEDWEISLIRFVTNRRVVDMFRRRQRYITMQCDLTDLNMPSYDMEGLDKLLDMRKLWEGLSKKERKLMGMVVEGRSHNEMAERLGSTPSATRDKMYRLRLILSGKAPITTRMKR